MIQASHNRLARFIFNPYLQALLRKNFGHFYLLNDPPGEAMEDRSLLLTPNHFSWWDGFFIDYLNTKILKRKFHILMLEDQLRKYWFFRYLGAYSINPDNPKSIIETARYTASILKNKNNMAAFYPQGKIEDYSLRPFRLKPGLGMFLKYSGNETPVLIVSFKIRYRENKKPDIMVRFGETFSAREVITGFEAYSHAFNNSLNCLDSESAGRSVFSSDLFEIKDRHSKDRYSKDRHSKDK